MNMMRRTIRTTIVLLLTVLVLGSGIDSAIAAVSGKISGLVEDQVTGDPLVGATVSISGTNLKTKTDIDGEYFFLNVPVGAYTVVVSHVGFDTLIKKNVRVLVDLTTPLDFELLQVAVNISEPSIVTAERPLIQPDLTATRVTFTSERLQTLPNIITVDRVLSNYPGVVEGRDRNIHVRGGRSGQLNYLYDGFSIQDPFISDAGIRIIPAALEELSLTSGGFGAEYGDAQSGIVSAITRQGTDRYTGSFTTYESATHQYDVNRADWGGLKRLGGRSAAFDLSGPIPGMDPKRYTFFTAGQYLRANNHLPHNWSLNYTGTAKLAMQPTSRLKILGHVSIDQANGDLYYHRDGNGASFNFNLDGLPSFERKAHLIGLTGHYYMSDAAIVSLAVNRFNTWTKTAPQNLFDLHWSEWPGYSEDSAGNYNGTIQENNYLNGRDPSNLSEVVGFLGGDRYDPTYGYRETTYNGVYGSITWQANKNNQIKAGFDVRLYDVTRDFRQFYNVRPYAETYETNPTYASAYIQDKLEYKEFVINLGLRYDYRHTDVEFRAADLSEDIVESEAKTSWAPRLGVSFPIGESSAMHFNYGVYYQMPEYFYLYFNLEGETNSGLPLLGNPNLKPEKTTSYEIGLDQLIGDNLRLDVTAFYKDVADLVTSTWAYNSGTTPVTRFVNNDYGSITGFDLGLELLPSNGHLTGQLAYTFMQAKGSGSDPLDPYYNGLTSSPDSVLPVTEYNLDFDQRHTVNLILDYRVPQDWSTKLFGVKVPGGWGLTAVGAIGSGLPYTKTDQSGQRLGERNEGRLPAVYSLDMRFNKDFFVAANTKLTWFLEVDNVFNRRNVINVYSRSGLPDDDLSNITVGISANQQEAEELDRLYDHDPLNFSAPRTVRSGLQLSF